MTSTGEALSLAVAALRAADFAVALTGAGVSAASGVPTFRAEGGVWTRFPVEEHGTAAAFERDPERCWHLFGTLARDLERAAPNPAHRALAELESMGRLEAVITQNIDALHQRAGSDTVVEYHGTAASAHCPRCGRRFAAGDVAPWPPAPRCPDCDAVLRPDIVLFGDPIPQDAAIRADVLCRRADLLIAVGTTLEVSPASWLATTAAARGAGIVVVDPEPSAVARRVASVVLAAPAEEVLPEIVARLKLRTPG